MGDDLNFKNTIEVPIGMLVPASRTVYQIIEKTAEFYKKVGSKSFTKLRDTQQQNPSFSFLKKRIRSIRFLNFSHDRWHNNNNKF